MAESFNRYVIEDRSYVAFIRREIHQKVVAAKFDSVDTGKIDIIVAELTTNLIKHAGSGEILYRLTTEPEQQPVFEIVCIDKGPGIEDISVVMRDGMSTTKTLGHGLGAIDRLSTQFQMYSMRGWGTIFYSRFGGKPRSDFRQKADVDIQCLMVPKPPEEVCGDGCAVVNSPSKVKIIFGDGLGHGKHAKEAIDAACRYFITCGEDDPVDILRGIHDNVRRTRGLVASVAVLDKATNEWKFCGIGNISTRLYTGIEYRNYMSYNGTIGLNIPKSMNSTPCKSERNQHLIMCSDGLTTRWDLNRYPSVFKHEQMILAAALYKDFSRGHDDASILIAKVI
ncbi:MAG TPA: ATP-binding protein [Cyclobacteriaceae bacterium]|nr:ATP-binding protein [Cyclobacteriaceae bacterium]